MAAATGGALGACGCNRRRIRRMWMQQANSVATGDDAKGAGRCSRRRNMCRCRQSQSRRSACMVMLRTTPLPRDDQSNPLLECVGDHMHVTPKSVDPIPGCSRTGAPSYSPGHGVGVPTKDGGGAAHGVRRGRGGVAFYIRQLGLVAVGLALNLALTVIPDITLAVDMTLDLTTSLNC
eukprot:351307-Chlamydomonas_euryale.AAC.1